MGDLIVRRRMLVPSGDPFDGYVQTDLAYQLDGIWNTITGHDATSDRWYNHKSANPFKGYLYTNSSVIGDKYCIPNDRMYYRGIGTSSNSNMIQMSDSYSIEICVDIVGGEDQYQWIFANRGNGYGTTYIDTTNGHLLFAAKSGGGALGVATSSGIHTYVATGSNGTTYVDGQAVSSIRGGSGASSVDRHFAFYYTTSYPHPCISKIYAIRLYSRALTATEVLQNYNIDRIRFGSGVS